MSNLKTFFYETYTKGVDYLTNPLDHSEFLKKGVLTPEEFVQAGDLLVLKCPSWSWVAAKDPKMVQKGLPAEKQFLITKNVPSIMRITELEKVTNATKNELWDEDEEGGWIATHTNEMPKDEDIVTIPLEDDEDINLEDIPEVNLDDLTLQDEDPQSVASKSNSNSNNNNNFVKRRTYDISICYDQYHQTPRVWLFGYNENKQPLTPEQVLQDVSQDHAAKTVTVAAHPHTGIQQAYIHPCKHAAVMKKMVERMIEHNKTPRVDLYLFIFLKFLHAAIPTIEYDFTIDFDI